MFRKIAPSLAILAFASGAMAADLPARAPAPAPYISLPVFTWTGFYVGLNAGGAFNGNNNRGGFTPLGFPVGINGNPAAANILGGGIAGNDGSFLGGAQIGYNWQAGSIVYGIEADIQGLARNSNRNGVAAIAPVAGLAGIVPYAIATNGNNSSNYFGTVRGRLGYAMDRALFYVTGGLAYGGTRGGGSVAYFNQTNATAIPTATYSGGGNNSRVGYTVGAGLEYALTNNWTVKGEYLYADLGRRNRALTSAALPTTSFVGGNNNSGLHVVRLGVNYKF